MTKPVDDEPRRIPRLPRRRRAENVAHSLRHSTDEAREVVSDTFARSLPAKKPSHEKARPVRRERYSRAMKLRTVVIASLLLGCSRPTTESKATPSGTSPAAAATDANDSGPAFVVRIHRYGGGPPGLDHTLEVTQDGSAHLTGNDGLWCRGKKGPMAGKPVDTRVRLDPIVFAEIRALSSNPEVVRFPGARGPARARRQSPTRERRQSPTDVDAKQARSKQASKQAAVCEIRSSAAGPQLTGVRSRHRPGTPLEPSRTPPSAKFPNDSAPAGSAQNVD